MTGLRPVGHKVPVDAIDTFLDTSTDFDSPLIWVAVVIFTIYAFRVVRVTYRAARGRQDFAYRTYRFLPLRAAAGVLVMVGLVWLDIMGGGRLVVPFGAYGLFLLLVLALRRLRGGFDARANAQLRRAAAVTLLLTFVGYVAAESKRRWFVQVLDEGFAKLPKAP